MKKLLPPTLFLICIVTMVVLWWLVPIKQLGSFPMNLLGLLPLISGVGLSTRGSEKFRKLGTNIKTFDEPNILVKDGIFQYSRNPMYLGFVIALCGVSVLLGSLSTTFVVIAFWALTDRWYIEFEERAMLRKFGEDYNTYKSQVRRWI
jgi:protein-S-isoprenylcysteine O-methyltransferase Ste14